MEHGRIEEAVASFGHLHSRLDGRTFDDASYCSYCVELAWVGPSEVKVWASRLAVDVGGVMVTTAGSVLFGEHRLAYDVTGTGPTVVLIPGVMMHRGRWHALDYVERLAVHYQIVATDPLGHGESDKPVVAAAYDLNCCADHVVAVLDDVGVDRAAIWGYSRGGAIAAAMVGHRPDRLWAVVTGGFGFRETPTWPDEAVAALEAGDWDGFFARSGLELPDHVRRYMTELNDPSAIAAAIRGSRSSELVAVASPVPVLMYNGDGEDDDVLDSRAAEAVGFVCRVLPTGGHAETFAAVEQVLTVVEPFLATAAPPAD